MVWYKGLDGRNTWRDNISVHLKRSAQARRCPKCGRGAALKCDMNPAIGSVIYCRWKDCGWEKVLDPMRG